MLYHWISAKQVPAVFGEDRLLATWRHFHPYEGRMVHGICCYLRETGWGMGQLTGCPVCLVLDEAKIGHIPRIDINGYRVYALTENVKTAILVEGRPYVVHPTVRQLADKARSISQYYFEDPDEAFLMANIPKLSACVSSVLVMPRASAKVKAAVDAWCVRYHVEKVILSKSAA